MRAVPPRAAAPDPAPYAAAEAAFAEAKAYLCSREAQQMSESDLERELHRRGQALMRKLLQGHLDQRSPGEAAGPVAGADGVERSERRVHQRHIETTFGTVEVERLGYARAGHDSLHPLDAALNLPPERYSLEVRRRVAEAAASRSFDEALLCARLTGEGQPVEVRRKEGVTNHFRPESCAGRCEAAGEALTGARTGRAIEHRKRERLERRDCHSGRRQHRHHRNGEGMAGSCARLTGEG